VQFGYARLKLPSRRSNEIDGEVVEHLGMGWSIALGAESSPCGEPWPGKSFQEAVERRRGAVRGLVARGVDPACEVEAGGAARRMIGCELGVSARGWRGTFGPVESSRLPRGRRRGGFAACRGGDEARCGGRRCCCFCWLGRRSDRAMG